MIRYCLPIVSSSCEEVMRTIKAQEKKFSFFEVWLDYLKDFNTEFLDTLIDQQGDKLLLLTRRKKLELPTMRSEERLSILESCVDKACYVDLDLTSQKEELRYCKEKKLKLNLLASYHNYQKTPSDEELHGFLREMEASSPKIVKLATFCRSREDGLRLLDLAIELSEKNQRFIVLGMGQHGVTTRIFGTLWGNEMIFAPTDLEKSSAPGQLTRDQLDLIFTLLGETNGR